VEIRDQAHDQCGDIIAIDSGKNGSEISLSLMARLVTCQLSNNILQLLTYKRPVCQ